MNQEIAAIMFAYPSDKLVKINWLYDNLKDSYTFYNQQRPISQFLMENLHM